MHTHRHGRGAEFVYRYGIKRGVVRGRDGRLNELDQEFDKHVANADVAHLLEEKLEDERLGPLLQTALECLLHERALPPGVDSFVDASFTGGEKTRPLHARLRLIFRKENEREEHYCVRALQLTNAKAYQARLKAAMTQSGIDRTLKFRRLTVVRTKPLPGGAETKNLTEKFTLSGGVFVNPAEQELRIIQAIHKMKARGDPDFETWLKARQPISRLKLSRDIVRSDLLFPASPLEKQPGAAESALAGSMLAAATRRDTGENETVVERSPNTPAVTNASARDTGKKETVVEHADPTHRARPMPASAQIPLGRRVLANRPGEPIGIPIKLLEKHTLVLAGAGSGKTVLLKRLVEEAPCSGFRPSLSTAPMILQPSTSPGSHDRPTGSKKTVGRLRNTTGIATSSSGHLERKPGIPSPSSPCRTSRH